MWFLFFKHLKVWPVWNSFWSLTSEERRPGLNDVVFTPSLSNVECLLYVRPCAKCWARAGELGWGKLRINQNPTVSKQALALKEVFAQNIHRTEARWFWISRSGWENLGDPICKRAKWRGPAIGPGSYELQLLCLPVSPFPSPVWPPKQASYPPPLLLSVFSIWRPEAQSWTLSRAFCSSVISLLLFSAQGAGGTDLPGSEGGPTSGRCFPFSSRMNLDSCQPTASEVFSESWFFWPFFLGSWSAFPSWSRSRWCSSHPGGGGWRHPRASSGIARSFCSTGGVLVSQLEADPCWIPSGSNTLPYCPAPLCQRGRQGPSRLEEGWYSTHNFLKVTQDASPPSAPLI